MHMLYIATVIHAMVMTDLLKNDEKWFKDKKLPTDKIFKNRRCKKNNLKTHQN